MRAAAGGLSQVADGTFIESACVALQVDELDRIFGLRALCNGMRAVVAGFAVYPAVSLRLAIKSLVLVIGSAGMAGIAARFI